MKKELIRGNLGLLCYYLNGKNMIGLHSDLNGDCTGLRGDCTWLRGDCTDIS